MRHVGARARLPVLFLLTCLAFGAGTLARQQLVPATPAGQPPGTPTPTGFVLGVVVDVGDGKPVPGATVTLTAMGQVTSAVAQAPPPLAPGEAPRVPRRVMTDADGRFFFRELPGGRYGVAVSAAGYMPGGYLQQKPGGTVHFLDLSDDARRGDVQIRLWKYASISGALLDETGEPAVGTYVSTMRRTIVGGRPRFSMSGRALTDDRGIYRVSTLAPGDYIVGMTVVRSTLPAETVEAFTQALDVANPTLPPVVGDLRSSGVVLNPSGFRVGGLILEGASVRTGYAIPQPGEDGTVRAYATTFYPSTALPGQATLITLGSGEERTGVDLSLKLVPTARVSGTVMDRDGPARNIGVRLLPLGSDEFLNEGGTEAATTATDGTGAFTFLGVPSGQYTLKVLKAPRPTGPALSTEPTLWANLPVTVASTDVMSLSVALKTGLRVSGRVEFEGTKDKPTAAQLARVSIALTPLDAQPIVPFTPGAVNADGQFSTMGYPPGRYFVTAFTLPGWTLKGVMLGGRNVTDEPLELEASEVAGLVAVFSDKSAVLSGSVVDARGVPDPTSEVIIFPADSQSWRQNGFSARRARLMSTTKTGDYEFTDVPAGQYFIAAIHFSQTDDWQDPKLLDRLQGVATRVTIAEGEKKKQALQSVTVR